MKLILGVALLSAAAQAAEVTFFTGSDCKQDDKLGDTISVPCESGNVEWARDQYGVRSGHVCVLRKLLHFARQGLRRGRRPEVREHQHWVRPW
jgi:hypothetical protein